MLLSLRPKDKLNVASYGYPVMPSNIDESGPKKQCLTLEKNCVNIKNVEKFQKKRRIADSSSQMDGKIPK